MKCCFRITLLIATVVLICFTRVYGYKTNDFPKFKFKNETENLLIESYSPEGKPLNFSEEELFYTAMNSGTDDQFQAGLLFGLGRDVQRNFSKCIALLQKAADRGHPEAAFLLGTIYLKGGSIFKEIRSDVEYGGIFIPGDFPYDLYRAFSYFLISGSKGDKLSYKVCSLIKKQYIDNETDAKKAKRMFLVLQDSADDGYSLAHRLLAELYSDGRIVGQDDYRAFDLFKQSAELGDVWGEYNTARKYIAGLGVEQNTAKGFEWMKKAAEHDLAVAQFDLAVLYYLGSGTEPDRQMGYVWLIIAKANGHKEAESIVNESENIGLTSEEQKKAHEIANKLRARISIQREAGKLVTAFSKF